MSDYVDCFVIKPSYEKGFTYSWEYKLGTDINDIPTIIIVVQHSPDGISGWEDFSPELTSTTSWSPGHVSKFHAGHDEFYRIKTTLSGDTTYTDPAGVYSLLTKREMLLGRNLIRHEKLAAQTTGGTDVQTYQQRIDVHKDPVDAKCDKCTDPVSGIRYTDDCKYCSNTEADRLWLGPYDARVRFLNADKIDTDTDPTGGVRDVRPFIIRLPAAPVLAINDVIVELASDRRYIVKSVAVVAELSRVPILQDATVVLLEYEHPAYNLGVDNGS